jgi:parallel beta-helix repeat protein
VRRLTIDGTGSTCPAGANRVVGIELNNIGLGDPEWNSSAGTVDANVVRNLNACDLAEGIDSEYSGVTINANDVHDIGRNCITETGAVSVISNNRIQNCHMAGILMNSGGATSLIQGNTVYAPRGIEVNRTSDIKITSNIVGPFTGIGILLVESSDNEVDNNQVNASFAGIWMFKGAGTNIISNSIAYSHYGIVDEVPIGGGNPNSITDNTVNEAAIGLVMYNTDGSGDTLAPNSLYNCVVRTSPSF